MSVLLTPLLIFRHDVLVCCVSASQIVFHLFNHSSQAISCPRTHSILMILLFLPLHKPNSKYTSIFLSWSISHCLLSPVWLDLLYIFQMYSFLFYFCCHSNSSSGLHLLYYTYCRHLLISFLVSSFSLHLPQKETPIISLSRSSSSKLTIATQRHSNSFSIDKAFCDMAIIYLCGLSYYCFPCD